MDTTTSIDATSEQPTSAPLISEAEKIRAALNLPADQFVLGDRTFNIVDLDYDDYVRFAGYLQPIVELFVKQTLKQKKISLPGIEVVPQAFDPTMLVTLCGKVLPELVQIMCKQSDPDITVEEVKKLGKKPHVLALAVMKQVKQNGIIRDFADFFVQIAAIWGLKELKLPLPPQ